MNDNGSAPIHNIYTMAGRVPVTIFQQLEERYPDADSGELGRIYFDQLDRQRYEQATKQHSRAS